MVDTVDYFSFTTDAASVDYDAMKKRYTDEQLANTTKRSKPRRKFHDLDCECTECIERYGETVVPPQQQRPLDDVDIDPAFRETNQPTLPCMCYMCFAAARDAFPQNINKNVHVFFRRSNNCTCTCGVCMSCIPDFMYFKIISEHIDHIYTCPCMFCQNYRAHHTRFGRALL